MRTGPLSSGRSFPSFCHGFEALGQRSASLRSQGLPAERVLVSADTGVPPDFLNSRFGYVSISRASHEATLFTDDITKLNPKLCIDVSKTSAIEMSQTLSVVKGFGMGI
jgi:hypothetical protein